MSKLGLDFGRYSGCCLRLRRRRRRCVAMATYEWTPSLPSLRSPRLPPASSRPSSRPPTRATIARRAASRAPVAIEGSRQCCRGCVISPPPSIRLRFKSHRPLHPIVALLPVAVHPTRTYLPAFLAWWVSGPTSAPLLPTLHFFRRSLSRAHPPRSFGHWLERFVFGAVIVL